MSAIAPPPLSSLSGRIVVPYRLPQFISVTGVGGSGAWPTNNKAILIPLFIEPWEVPMTVISMGHNNGASAVTGTFDMGIYNYAGGRLGSVGSTSQAGAANAFVTYNLATPAVIHEPGIYYVAMSASTTSATYFRTTPGTTAITQAMGILEATTSHPLPDPITFAATSQTFIPTVVVIPSTGV